MLSRLRIAGVLLKRGGMQCAKELQSPLHPREPDPFCSFSSDPVRLILGKVTGTGLRFRGLGFRGLRV